MTTDAQLTCFFPTTNSLYMAYMPFLIGGGLFVRTSQILPMGTKIHLKVSLPNEEEKFLIDGKIVWITPRAAQGNKPSGLGVQFIGEEGRYFRNKIETLLAGMLKSTQLPDTM